MQESNHDAKTIRFRAAEKALLSQIATGATDDAVLDEFFRAANEYRNEGYPSGVTPNYPEVTESRLDPLRGSIPAHR
jgi:hypothetical protein